MATLLTIPLRKLTRDMLHACTPRLPEEYHTHRAKKLCIQTHNTQHNIQKHLPHVNHEGEYEKAYKVMLVT